MFSALCWTLGRYNWEDITDPQRMKQISSWRHHTLLGAKCRDYPIQFRMEGRGKGEESGRALWKKGCLITQHSLEVRSHRARSRKWDYFSKVQPDSFNRGCKVKQGRTTQGLSIGKRILELMVSIVRGRVVYSSLHIRTIPRVAVQRRSWGGLVKGQENQMGKGWARVVAAGMETSGLVWERQNW